MQADDRAGCEHVTVSDSNGLGVDTVVRVQDKEMKEPRFLMFSERKVVTCMLIRYYAKRWEVEKSFGDIKDMRFGMGFCDVCFEP